jgi:arylsulfatase A-like enzyme
MTDMLDAPAAMTPSQRRREIATILARGVLRLRQGYATGQFGKNHQGDLNEHLPTIHGFDEFLGNLYHLNAEEEPENEDYPRDLKLKSGVTFLEAFGPRGVLHCNREGHPPSRALPAGGAGRRSQHAAGRL